MKKFEIGEYVIVNEFDRPCARLIARVTGANECLYISGKLKHDATMDLSRAISIKDFCVEVQFDTYQYQAVRWSETSNARYPSGAVRRWQECGESIQPIKQTFWGTNMNQEINADNIN